MRSSILLLARMRVRSRITKHSSKRTRFRLRPKRLGLRPVKLDPLAAPVVLIAIAALALLAVLLLSLLLDALRGPKGPRGPDDKD
jgi:hypothetical protein